MMLSGPLHTLTYMDVVSYILTIEWAECAESWLLTCFVNNSLISGFPLHISTVMPVPQRQGVTNTTDMTNNDYTPPSHIHSLQSTDSTLLMQLVG
jgi:hypothetical protein